MSSNLASSDSTSSADALLRLVNILFGKLSKCDSESILATMLQVINSQALEGKAKDSQILRLEQAIKKLEAASKDPAPEALFSPGSNNSQNQPEVSHQNRPELTGEWELLVNRRTESEENEKGLVTFETKLATFMSTASASDSDGNPLRPWNIPWPSLEPVSKIDILFSVDWKTVAAQLFTSASKVRTKQEAVNLMRQTVAAFQPEAWKARNMLDRETHRYLAENHRVSYAREALSVSIVVAQLLKEFEKD